MSMWLLRIKGGDSCLPTCTNPSSEMPAAFFISALEMVVVTTFLLNFVGHVVCLAKLCDLLHLCFHIWKTCPIGNDESFVLMTHCQKTKSCLCSKALDGVTAVLKKKGKRAEMCIIKWQKCVPSNGSNALLAAHTRDN